MDHWVPFRKQICHEKLFNTPIFFFAKPPIHGFEFKTTNFRQKSESIEDSGFGTLVLYVLASEFSEFATGREMKLRCLVGIFLLVANHFEHM